MKIRKGLCLLTLGTVIAIQPALAAGAPSGKPKPAASDAAVLQLADVPMKGLTAADEAAATLKTTPRDDVGFDISELFSEKAACPSGGNATFTWTISDNCVDGYGIYVRFFDETNDIVFPNSSQVYSITAGRSGVLKLSVKRGAKICYGAEPTNRDGSYWGVSLDNDQSCASCCNIVPNTGNISRSVKLVCD